MSFAIIKAADNLPANENFAAWFFGQVDEKGIAHIVEWTGEGGDPAVQARVRAESAAGAVEIKIGLSSLKNTVLVGPMPSDGVDIHHNWRSTDFAKVIQ